MTWLKLPCFGSLAVKPQGQDLNLRLWGFRWGIFGSDDLVLMALRDGFRNGFQMCLNTTRGKSRLPEHSSFWISSVLPQSHSFSIDWPKGLAQRHGLAGVGSHSSPLRCLGDVQGWKMCPGGCRGGRLLRHRVPVGVCWKERPNLEHKEKGSEDYLVHCVVAHNHLRCVQVFFLLTWCFCWPEGATQGRLDWRWWQKQLSLLVSPKETAWYLGFLWLSHRGVQISSIGKISYVDSTCILKLSLPLCQHCF